MLNQAQTKPKSQNLSKHIQSIHVITGYTGYPLKLHFQIPWVFPVRWQIFPVPIYVICDYYIHKTELADLSSLKKNKFEDFGGKFRNIFYLWNQEIYNLSNPNCLCFGKISSFPVFSLTGNLFGHFPCFPCAVGTLLTV